MADTLNKLISNIINNEKKEVIKQYEYNLFSVLKFDSGIIAEITNAINTNSMSIYYESNVRRIIANGTSARAFIN
ncbi:hypothetical protein C2G38_2157741 [Gigaspora rosea]|uniref:Uncharacterized protein n=1 Tax=Gigaspora rosea TaxID=44941 RepID=A0A397W2T4_9GLOM|nr:hypothetical protein C2G38_2157741 [Gigaspora rosea]